MSIRVTHRFSVARFRQLRPRELSKDEHMSSVELPGTQSTAIQEANETQKCQTPVSGSTWVRSDSRPAVVCGSSQMCPLLDEKAYSTWYSQAVSHPSTNQARPCFASEIRIIYNFIINRNMSKITVS